MKKIIAGVFIIASIAACNSGTESSSSSSSTDTVSKMSSTEDTLKAVTDESQNDFVNTVGSAGMMEVELGKLAQTNASSKDVKDFGTMMVIDHTSAGSELKAIAQKNKISVPAAMTEEQTMHIRELTAKKGVDFDKAYIAMMVEGHEKVLAAFKKAATEETNADLKSFAIKTAPVIQKHLDKAKSLKAKM